MQLVTIGQRRVERVFRAGEAQRIQPDRTQQRLGRPAHLRVVFDDDHQVGTLVAHAWDVLVTSWLKSTNRLSGIQVLRLGFG